MHWISPDAETFTRDWLEDASHENGNYCNVCLVCKNMFIGHKRRYVCKVCYKKRED